jgi:hypothetical protein
VIADATALAALRGARRQRRLADIDVFEKLYQAYLSVVSVGIVVAVGASIVGDEHVGPRTLARVAVDGPAVVGLVAALVLVLGLRSGGRGGPLTLEGPFVQHVLLSPVPRDLALREPAFRQLTQSAITGGGVGALAGLLAANRLPVPAVPLTAWAAVAGVVVAVAATGAAMFVAGWPVPKPIVHVLCLVLLGASAADLAAGSAWSPGSIVGRLALGGVEVDPVGLIAVLIAVVLALAGIAVVGGTSVEAAHRRAGLVSQIRLAVTRQDLRTVVLLQRRLAQEGARRRPWFRIGDGRFPVFRRGLQSLSRLPLVRVLRPLSLCAVSVGAAVAAWRGSTPLIVVSGLALFGAALDLVEPLAQELDHPDRGAGYPLPFGDLLTRHLVAPVVGLFALACIPVAVLAIAATDHGAVLQTAAGTLLPACVAAVLAASASVATAPFDPSSLQTVMPETIGMQLIMRVAWPPAVAILATLPVLAARAATDDELPPITGATQYLLLVCVMLGLVTVWLSRRKPGRV